MPHTTDGFTFDTSCLFSVVKNISGVKKKFPTLPPHGVELDADEQYSIWGSVLEAILRGDRFGRANSDALEKLLDQRLLEIRKLPKPIMEDETLNDIKVITLDNGSLVLEDPCWETSLTV